MLSVSASVLLSAATADAQVYVEGGIYAQPTYVQPQTTYQTAYYTHTGFFVRAAVGVGFGSFNYSPTGSSSPALSLSGVGVNYNLAAGLSVADNFALHIDVSGIALINPTLTLGGTTYAGTSSNDFTNSIIGAGFTYYVMPFNFYMSASLGLAYLYSSDFYGSTTGRSGIGFGVNALVGKDWALGTKWDFGLAAHLLYSAVPDGDGLWNNVGVGLMATFTRY